MTAIVDPVAAIRTLLLADADVHALVGASGVVAAIDEDIAKTMPKQIIVLKPSGGPRNRGKLQFGTHRLDVICYGPSLYDAWLVYLAAFGLLESIARATVNGVLIHSVDVTSKGDNGLDPIKQWPVAYSSWNVTASQIPAA